MKKRNPVYVSIFTLITFNIYELFWLYSTRKELVKRGGKVPRYLWFIAPVVFTTAILLVALFTAVSGAINARATNVAYNFSSTQLAFLVPAIFTALVAFAICVYWLFRYSQAVDKVTKGRMSFMLAFCWLVVFPFLGSFLINFVPEGSLKNASGYSSIILGAVGVGVIQASYNKVGASKK